eukprot:jgi/Chlat1/3132/Chrsp21S03361
MADHEMAALHLTTSQPAYSSIAKTEQNNGEMQYSQTSGVGHSYNGKHWLRHPENRRAFLAVVPTLTLGIMGSAVLPVSWAFSITGIVCGFLIMVVVSAANAYTCDLLLRQAWKSRQVDYETLAFAVGGKIWRFITEVSIVVLLLGTIIGGILQVGEICAAGFIGIWGEDRVPGWVVDGGGRVVMAIATVGLVAPLCLVKQLRQLEYVGVAGVVIVMWMLVTIVVNAIQAGLPAIGNGEFEKVGFTSLSNITQAVSTFGFAFYIQPVMMPFLAEMPKGYVGVKILSWGTRIVVLINAFLTYAFIGFFGAARYGASTEDDILVNEWLGGGTAYGILNVLMALYLALSLPPIEFPTRHTIDRWLPDSWISKKRFPMLRHIIETALILSVCLLIAELFPNNSGNVLVVTGATGVAMVSYVIPVVNHLLMYFNWSYVQRDARRGVAAHVYHMDSTLTDNDGSQYGGHVMPKLLNETGVPLAEAQPQIGPHAIDEAELADPLTYRKMNKYKGVWGAVWELAWEVLVPVIVVAVGVFASVSALVNVSWSSFLDG